MDWRVAARGLSAELSSSGEFSPSRNGSKATMPARLASSSIWMLSDAVVSMFDAFVAQTRLCVFMLAICYAMISQLRAPVRCQLRTSVRCRGQGPS